jgi:glyceraldehyde-3-phosphate dehydrogenase/erythrose-4-phosphate dehydrogenase
MLHRFDAVQLKFPLKRHTIFTMASSVPVGVDHVVMLKFKPDVTEEQVDALKKATSKLLEIDGVVAVTGGRVFVEDWMQDRRGDASITYGLRVRLVSKDDLKVYQSHTLHLKVIKENIAPLLSAPVIAFDWESDEAK